MIGQNGGVTSHKQGSIGFLADPPDDKENGEEVDICPFFNMGDLCFQEFWGKHSNLTL